MRHQFPSRLRLLRLALVPVLAFAGVTQAAGGAGAATTPRAMWVWNTSDPSSTVDLAKAQGITQLFVAVPPRVTSSDQLPALRTLSGSARAAGIRVDALGGDPGWIDNPKWAVDNWLRPAIGTGLFTGVHVDIEPYTTSAWQTDQAGTVSRYLNTLTALVKAAGRSVPVEADIPFWFNGIPAGTSTLDREVIKRTAATAIMAYRNTAAGSDGSIALAGPEVSAANQLGKPVHVGQETSYLGSDPTEVKQTFYGQTRTQMETQLAQLEAAFQGTSRFAGIAIHDYTGYAAMAP